MHASLILIVALVGQPALAADESKNRPVTKVVNLLKDMIAQMEKEAEEDEETYEQMGCWCETNDKLKTKSIADAEQAISDLNVAIEGFTAASARLNQEIPALEGEVAKNEEALDKATAMRKKELAEFNAEEKETIQTIASLKSAVVALSKHHEAASFLQEDTTTATMERIRMWGTLKQQLHKNEHAMKHIFKPSQRRALTYFVQQQLNGQAPASGEIFGMLKQMKESFETNLANSQKEETVSQKDYEALKAAKEEEIAAATDLIGTKTQELATADEKNVQSKEQLEETQSVLAADTKFLANLKEQCAVMDADYEARVKVRQQEIQACSKALAFLSSDEAHELFSKTLGFMQMSSTAHSKRRAQVSRILTQAAHKFNDKALYSLAVSTRIDAFTEVKAKIQEMIDTLVKEKQDEIKLKDFCISELNTNEAETEAKTRDKDDLAAKIEDLASSIDTLGKDIETLKAEVTELGVQLKRAGEDREKENKEFQIVVADQRATIKLITAALDILKGFYEKAALVQKNVNSRKAAQPAFKPAGSSKQSGGVMGMMEEIIGEAKGMEADAIRAESDAQTAYETFVKDTNDSITAKTKDIVSKSDMKAKGESDKVEKGEESEAVIADLESLASENADLHKSCDFTLKNFDLRQGARDDEIEALKQALSIFSGAKFSAFLQNY
jgi:hypothetical protein